MGVTIEHFSKWRPEVDVIQDGGVHVVIQDGGAHVVIQNGGVHVVIQDGGRKRGHPRWRPET